MLIYFKDTDTDSSTSLWTGLSSSPSLLLQDLSNGQMGKDVELESFLASLSRRGYCLIGIGIRRALIASPTPPLRSQQNPRGVLTW